MSYNFYNNFHHNATFQNAFLPPPPPPPAFFMLPENPQDVDRNFVKQFESKMPRTLPKQKPMSISVVRDQIYSLLINLKEIKANEEILSDKIKDLTDEEWSSKMQEIDENKKSINRILSNINNLNVEVLQKLLAKRSMKRARLKRLRAERKKEKDEWIKQMKEQSRQIDEKLQKIKDDYNKGKQEEEAKIQADLVLKETLRKKHDAKRYIVKLDALMKLRKARQNTAKGRGESVLDAEADTFNNNIGKLKSLWNKRLSIYEKEEQDLRAKLLDPEVQTSTIDNEKEVEFNLTRWKEVLFGGGTPQANFRGDVRRFISVRHEWDEFLSEVGTSLPIGWVPPPPLSLNFLGQSQ